MTWEVAPLIYLCSSCMKVCFQVLATAGDTRLGGDDIDEALAQWCWSQLDTGESFDNLANQERPALVR